MTRARRPAARAIRWTALAARLALAGLALSRLARAAGARPPLVVDHAAAGGPVGSISVVIPARDEEGRIGPLLEALRHDPAVAEVLVVDDESRDGTAALATRLGATVVPGAPLPPGWVGKPWALEQGLRAAHGDWVVTMDADVVPEPGLPAALVERAATDGLDLVSVAGRFACPTAPLRWLHPALLTTLVYRFGPPGAARPARPRRVLSNGQCTACRREALMEAGGYQAAAGHLTDDVALARAMAEQGWRTALLDGSGTLVVRMHEDAAGAWREWGRSLPMPDVTSPGAQLLDAATLLVAQALPLPRLLFGRGDALDVALLAVRLGTLVGTRRAYERVDAAYWLSPLADLPGVSRVLWGAVRPGRSWRGRTYAG